MPAAAAAAVAAAAAAAALAFRAAVTDVTAAATLFGIELFDVPIVLLELVDDRSVVVLVAAAVNVEDAVLVGVSDV